MPLIVKCPTCGRNCEYSEKNPWRPFCCERCKVIDLGAWASDKYVIPDKPIEGEDEVPVDIQKKATKQIIGSSR